MILTKASRGLIAASQIMGATSLAPAWAGCSWSDLVTDKVQAAAVRSAEASVHFRRDDVLVKGCPNETPACRSKAFLRPGDIVLAGPVRGDYTCSGFTRSGRSATTGWLPTKSVARLPGDRQTPGDWIGHWVGGAQTITIAPGSADALTVKGRATWNKGAYEHVGEIEGVTRPDHGVLAFTMGDVETLPYDKGEDVDCRVRMIRRGPYLLVRDNLKCGGANVSFSDFYRRTSQTK